MPSGKGSNAGVSRMAPSTGNTYSPNGCSLTNSTFDNLRFHSQTRG